jgi:hypothetical protein
MPVMKLWKSRSSKGLIRYATEAEIENQEKFKFTSRMKATAAFLCLLIGF